MSDETAVVIQIGNTDNKLTQQDWAMFYGQIHALCANLGVIHFAGASDGICPWQNACIAATFHSDTVPGVLEAFAQIRAKYNQDSVAVLTGATQFI